MKRQTQKDQSKPERVVITARADAELKGTFEQEAPLRGHTASQAYEIALKLGLPLYLKRHQKRFEPVKKAA